MKKKKRIETTRRRRHRGCRSRNNGAIKIGNNMNWVERRTTNEKLFVCPSSEFIRNISRRRTTTKIKENH